MTLREVVSHLDKLDPEAMICVRRPWGLDAEAWVGKPNESLGVPAHVKSMGYDYFLEAGVVEEVLEGWTSSRTATTEAKAKFLIYYAENDAFPDWAANPGRRK